MQRLFSIQFIALLIVLVAGCCIRPDSGPPGTIFHQRNRAVIHDPFPSRFIGPEIEGVRPMEYSRPIDEATLNQTNPYARKRPPGF